MSNKRRAKPRKVTNYIGGIPNTSVTPGEAEEFQQSVADAPMLELPDIHSSGEQGLVLNVDKVGFLGGAEGILSGTGAAYIETTDATIYRLPAELGEWASGVVSVVLVAGGRKSGIFPTDIEFGRLDGRAYAEML